MKKDWILTLGITVISAITALMLIRWYAPQLLGINADLRMVTVSEKKPAFYDNVFRKDDIYSKEFIISDPVLVNRAMPLYPNIGTMGPNDILGFRNKSVPNVADIITIGDSQTYGNNATITNNWPGHLKKLLSPQTNNVVYNMSVGAWGATNYLEILKKAVYLKPKIVIVAFYTGNDPLSDFRNAYTYDKWADLRPDENLNLSELPKAIFPPPIADLLPVRYKDGVNTLFTPKYRHASNQYNNKTIRAAYKIIARVALKMRDVAVKNNIALYFTIIPTKELVYSRKTKIEGLEIPKSYIKKLAITSERKEILKKEYHDLVENEQKNIDDLTDAFNKIENTHYIDVIKKLQKEALNNTPLYPTDPDGHPVSNGYEIIAKSLHSGLELKPLKKTSYGLVGLTLNKTIANVGLYSDRGYEKFISLEAAVGNGWKQEDLTILSKRDFFQLKKSVDVINTQQPEKYGPKYINEIAR